ncbi:hypothetical protein OIU34_22225 [Pararhizobium sp. BT-229]|uniref:hypothetical protein n=1 Tax=Pararhizobium sp. BT-229 TaxID=2986923 RepID=UPI0021F7F3C4|nr:hypothetical protein [Pararhizobium sp. BT-229]MCV9964611.1 hypothetical protein [Pararhizobium sp. BT-229]
MVILNAFTRLLCRFPTIATDGGVGVSLSDVDIVHAIHDALLLSLIELEKTDLVGASLSMEPEFPEVLAVIAENLSGRQDDADMRDSLINLSDRFLTYGGRLKHRSSTFARSLPYVVIPNGPSRPCQLFHALCSDLGVQAETAEDLIAAMHGFDQWKDLLESAQEPGEIKGVFDEDCSPPELAERRRLQIAILISLEFPDDQTASIWDRLRPTARSGMPRLDGFRKTADRF